MNEIPPAINTESEVPPYALPVLKSPEEARALFEEHIYGRFPDEIPEVSVDLLEEDTAALGGLAYRQQLRVILRSGETQREFGLLVYTPASARKPVPAFLELNFAGNHAAHPDPAILLTTSWCPAGDQHGVVDHRATEAGRGTRLTTGPIESIIFSGFGFATVYCGDLAPDDPEHVEEGMLAFYPRKEEAGEARGGAVSAWAWGLSRALDALATLPEIDPTRVAVIGHSRLGKAALWAGACDERFSLVISNNSGCTGAALARRRFGERVAHINRNFPHWFARKYHSYNEREEALPVDQHQVIALVAPRAVYVASAIDDVWADPKGEYLALAAAAPAWHDELPADPPPVEAPLHHRKLGYHVRSGGHGLTHYDWIQFLEFASRSVIAS
jgi:hypothetical protein